MGKLTLISMLGAISLILAVSCSKKSEDEASGGGGSTTNYTISGSLASANVMGFAKHNGVRAMTTKTITHIMAISPQTSSPERYVSAISTDGSFSLGIKAGAPYVFVFIDENQVGDDMIVGIFDPGDNTSGLDTLVPATEGGSADLGTVTVDGTSQAATMSTSFSTFLSALGIDSTTAATIGAVDDLTLRAANPDVDSNGEIDAIEGKQFWLDFHIRTNTSCTSCSQNTMPYDLINGTFISDVPGFAITPSGSSIYAVHTSSFDATDMTTYFNSGVSTTLSGGASLAVTDMPGGATADIDTPDHYSGGSFGDYRQWGPDYELGTNGVELPGYDTPVKMVWTMAGAKTLTFSHLRTRAKSSLFSLLPDIKFVSTGGVITSLDYRWMKWTGSTWAAATAAEVGLIVSSSSAYAGFYTSKSGSSESGVGVTIPATSASGSIAWVTSNVNVGGTIGKAVEELSIDDFCSGTASYDDKLGLRNFAYSFRPAASSSLSHCP